MGGQQLVTACVRSIGIPIQDKPVVVTLPSEIQWLGVHCIDGAGDAKILVVTYLCDPEYSDKRVYHLTVLTSNRGEMFSKRRFRTFNAAFVGHLNHYFVFDITNALAPNTWDNFMQAFHDMTENGPAVFRDSNFGSHRLLGLSVEDGKRFIHAEGRRFAFNEGEFFLEDNDQQ